MPNGCDWKAVNDNNVVDATHIYKIANILKAKNTPLFQICVIQRRDMDAPVDSSCLEVAEVSQKTRIRLGWTNKQPALNLPIEEGDIEELLKSVER